MSKVISDPPEDLSDHPALQPDHADPLSGIDPDMALWVDYDPDTVTKLSAEVIYSYDEGRSIVIAGTVPSWGYMARIAVPAVLRKPGPFHLRAGLVLRRGRLGLGVANDACTKFYDQTIIATPGQHLVELHTECADTPGNVVLRSGSPETAAVEFELLFLQFQLRSSEKRFKLTVMPEPKEAHPVFEKFPRWTGKISGYLTANWIGALIDTRFTSGGSRVTTETTIAPPYPRPGTNGEEYFEWIILLQSVLEAQKSFTMVELGAGYGRWLVNAWHALRSIGKADIPLMLIGVEAEPAHFAWMHEHFRTNGLDPERHRLINAAVAPSDGVVYFTTGHPNETYAQSIVNSPSVRFSKWPDMSVREVPAVSLQTVLDGVGEVDLLDMDIQDAEGNVVHASANLLEERVKTVYIGTHSEESEYLLRITFNRLGWVCRYDYPCHRTSLTPYGLIQFQDGVQCWINPRFASEETLLRFEQP